MPHTVSVIIPAYNEEAHIGATLTALNAASKKIDIVDIIVIDNASTDRTAEIAKSCGANVFTVLGGPVSMLRNFGVAKSRGSLLIFLDADVTVTDEWSLEIVAATEHLLANPAIATGSHCSPPANSKGFLERYWFSSFERAASSHLGTGHLIMTRELFDRVGGFSEQLETGEDYDICQRIKRCGGLIEENPRLRVIHNDFPKTILEFVGREAWHGSGDVKTIASLLRSKVALIAILFSLLHLGLAIFIWQQNFAASLFLLLLLVGLLIGVSWKKFSRSGFLTVGINSGIFYFYFVGRSISIMSAVRAWLKKL